MNSTAVLVAGTALVALASILASPRVHTIESFYKGLAPGGRVPGVWTLALSQVTTWIFARSIMNAIILGYFYGIGGALAYAAYYLSFVTGLWIVDSLRFRHGFQSVQAFLQARFGLVGTTCYNFVVALRLLSEVFANLLVVGLLFGTEGSQAYVWSIVAIGAVTAGYSMLGGLHASIRTDVMQMIMFLVILAVLIVVVATSGTFDVMRIMGSAPDMASPGWVLLAVALVQVWSYPLHDPVMMDRGFIADREVTRRSFYHAAWLSTLCILTFGIIGTWAGANKLGDETVIVALTRLLGEPAMIAFNLALIVSCMSTLDSTFASAAKLSVVDMRVGAQGVANGRLAMAAFLAGGLAMVFLGSKDLFAAVAVSGTASMYLAPVVFFSLWLGRDDIPVWSYLVSFTAAIAAAVLFFFYDNAVYAKTLGPLLGFDHKYSKLLILCLGVLIVGCGAFLLGMIGGKSRRAGRTIAPPASDPAKHM